MDGVTHVVHLATVKETPDLVMDVTVKGLFQLLEVAKDSPTFKQFMLIGGDAGMGHFVRSSRPRFQRGRARTLAHCLASFQDANSVAKRAVLQAPGAGDRVAEVVGIPRLLRPVQGPRGGNARAVRRSFFRITCIAFLLRPFWPSRCSLREGGLHVLHHPRAKYWTPAVLSLSPTTHWIWGRYYIQYGLNGCCLMAPWIMEKDDFKCMPHLHMIPHCITITSLIALM
jgi:hypothetical protein